MKVSYAHLLTALLLATYLLIVIGGATRVYDAGMSCPDWPHCYGAYIPFPESKIAGGYMVEGRQYTWWQVALEWSHRSLAALVGMGLLAALAWGLTTVRKTLPQVTKPLLATTALLVLQISLGAFTIHQANSPLSVILHLGTAMMFFAALTWLRRTVAANGKPQPLTVPTPVKGITLLFWCAVWLTMLLGAFVSSSHSGGVCGGLFSCAGQWNPTDVGQHAHMQHRYLALVTVILSIALLALAKRKAPGLRKAALHAHLMVWGQVALGIATLYSFASYPEYYFPLSIAHLAWGTLVWLVATGVVLNLHFGNAGKFHNRAA